MTFYSSVIRSNPLEIGLFASACESSETRSSFYNGSGTCKTKLYEKSFDPDPYTHYTKVDCSKSYQKRLKIACRINKDLNLFCEFFTFLKFTMGGTSALMISIWG